MIGVKVYRTNGLPLSSRSTGLPTSGTELTTDIIGDITLEEGVKPSSGGGGELTPLASLLTFTLDNSDGMYTKTRPIIIATSSSPTYIQVYWRKGTSGKWTCRFIGRINGIENLWDNRLASVKVMAMGAYFNIGNTIPTQAPNQVTSTAFYEDALPANMFKETLRKSFITPVNDEIDSTGTTSYSLEFSDAAKGVRDLITLEDALIYDTVHIPTVGGSPHPQPTVAYKLPATYKARSLRGKFSETKKTGFQSLNSIKQTTNPFNIYNGVEGSLKIRWPKTVGTDIDPFNVTGPVGNTDVFAGKTARASDDTITVSYTGPLFFEVASGKASQFPYRVVSSESASLLYGAKSGSTFRQVGNGDSNFPTTLHGTSGAYTGSFSPLSSVTVDYTFTYAVTSIWVDLIEYTYTMDAVITTTGSFTTGVNWGVQFLPASVKLVSENADEVNVQEFTLQRNDVASQRIYGVRYRSALPSTVITQARAPTRGEIATRQAELSTVLANVLSRANAPRPVFVYNIDSKANRDSMFAMRIGDQVQLDLKGRSQIDWAGKATVVGVITTMRPYNYVLQSITVRGN